LSRRSQTVKHIYEMKSQNQSLENVKIISHSDKVKKKAEIKLAAFFC